MSAAPSPFVFRALKTDALILCVLGAWIFIVKFLNPLCLTWAIAAVDGSPAELFVLWDFWWIAYLVLAWFFWRRKRYAWQLGIALSIVQTVLILFELWLLLSNPLEPRTPAPLVVDRFLAASWFLNQSVSLAFFLYLLLQLSQRSFRQALTQHHS